MSIEAGKWCQLPRGLNGRSVRILPAYLIQAGTSDACVLAVPIWVVEINRLEGWVRYRMPNQPHDIERTADFADVHSRLESALAAIGRILPGLHNLPANTLQDEPDITARS